MFGARYDLAVAYEELLRSDAVERGLVGPREADRMWDRHLLNCAVVAPAVPPGSSVLDIGSGAGLPGLVLAIARPDLTVCLVEPLLRRATFLSEAVGLLGLTDVEVRRARAEDLAADNAADSLPDSFADVVTARAVAPMDRLARWCLPLVRPGGLLLALKGARAADELAAVAGDLPGLGAQSWTVQTLGVGVVDPPARVIRIVRSSGGAQPRATRRRRNR